MSRSPWQSHFLPQSNLTLTLPASCPRALMSTLTTWEHIPILFYHSLPLRRYIRASQALFFSDRAVTDARPSLHRPPTPAQFPLYRQDLCRSPSMQVFVWVISLLSFGFLVSAAPTHVRLFVTIYNPTVESSLIYFVVFTVVRILGRLPGRVSSWKVCGWESAA